MPRPPPPGRTHCTTGRTDSGPAAPGLSNDGTRRWAPVSTGHRWSGAEPRSALIGTAARGAPARRRAPRRGRRRVGRTTRSAAAGRARTTSVLPAGSSVEPLPDQVPQPAPDPVADHRVADGLGHDEAGAGRRGGCSASVPRRLRRGRARVRGRGRSGGRRRRRGRRVGHRGPLRRSRCCAAVAARPPARLPTSPDRTRSASGRQAWCGPWRDGSRGWRGRHGCACAAGSRGSSRAGGCSAGRCACSRQALRFRTPRATGSPGSCGGPGHLGGGPRSVLPGDAGPRRGGDATADSKHPSP